MITQTQSQKIIDWITIDFLTICIELCITGFRNGVLTEVEALNTTFSKWEVSLSRSEDVRYHQANELIRKKYAEYFGCNLRYFMPENISMFDDDQLLACTGFRRASAEALYLEQYLETSVEDCLETTLGHPVCREKIVEIGGFAVGDPKFALPFMFRLAPVFAELGFTTAVCTVTYPVRSYLRKLGVKSICLGNADPAKVDTSDNAWGSYYKLRPTVLAGDIAATLEIMLPFKNCV